MKTLWKYLKPQKWLSLLCLVYVSIMHADRINVLEKGRITEIGTHDELLERKGLYYALWRQQVGERSLAREEPSGIPAGDGRSGL